MTAILIGTSVGDIISILAECLLCVGMEVVTICVLYMFASTSFYWILYPLC